VGGAGLEEALADDWASAAVLAFVSDGRFASGGAGASCVQRRTLGHPGASEGLNVITSKSPRLGTSQRRPGSWAASSLLIGGYWCGLVRIFRGGGAWVGGEGGAQDVVGEEIFAVDGDHHYLELVGEALGDNFLD
jgi:hypothetical protein